MATIEDVVTRVLSSGAVDAEYPIGYNQVARWASDRYRQLASRVRFRHRRKIGALALPAQINTGTATATRGASTLTLDADAQAAIGATSISTRWIRLSTTWYEIASYLGGTITLVTPFGEDSVTDGAYTIVKRYHELATNTQWLGRFVHPRRRQEIVNCSLSILDAAQPERQRISNPIMWAEAGRNAAGTVIRVELYPYAAAYETVYYVYWDKPTELTLSSTLPDGISEYALAEGTLIDLYRYRASQAANKNLIEQAAYWRNEWRAQSTSWERTILEITKADRPVDDISFILEHLGQAVGGTQDIRTAHDEVWNRSV